MMADAMTEKTGKKRGPAKADPENLSRAAYWYLERFATSAENLRRVLMRRIEKSAIAHGTDRDDGAAVVDAIIRRLRGDGLLDDAAYAEARARVLRAAGKPARAIKWTLAGKGVKAETVNRAIAAVDAENACDGEDADFRAAVKFAKRRRLGPYRDPARDPGDTGKEARQKRASASKEARQKKDLAALARAGFSYGVAEKIVKTRSREEPE